MERPQLLPVLGLILVCIATTVGAISDGCSIYKKLERGNLIRNIQIEKAASKSLRSREENLYVIESLFNKHPNPHPIAVEINYYVHIVKNISSTKFLPPAVEPHVTGHNSNDDCTAEQGCLVQVGWTTSCVYSLIRPKFLVTSQPAWFLYALEYSSDELYGFQEDITFHLYIPMDELPGTPSRIDFKCPLEKITAQLNNVSDNVAYVWCPQETKPKFLEITYLSSEILLSLVLVIIFNGVLHTYIQHLFKYHPEACLGFLTLWIVSHSIDIIYHLKVENLRVRNKGMIKFATKVTVEIISGLCGGGVCILKEEEANTNICKRAKFAFYGFILSTAGTSLALYSPPQIFFLSVYPVEILSTCGFALVCIAAFFMWPFMVKQFYNKNKTVFVSSCCKCTKCTAKGVFYILSYTLLVFLTYSFILLYLAALNTLKRSPGSQLLELALALFPPILGALLGFVLHRKFKEQNQIAVKKTT